MYDDPIDPIKEASKQYYRDNPVRAYEVHGQAAWIFVWILIIGAVVGTLMRKFG